MGYRLEAGEPVPQGVRRVATEQLSKAIEELTGGELEAHEAIHQARKRMKKVRGLLRLVRSDLGDVYSRENAWLRDTARRLSRLRDAEALIESFEALSSHYEATLESEVAAEVRKKLVERRRTIAQEEVDLDARVAETAEQLRTAIDRIESWPLSADGFTALGPGLERTYRRGRKGMAKAYRSPSPERFHEWRKRVKYSWYHSRLLRRIWPGPMKALRRELKSLSDQLGDDHDLTLLRQTLIEDTETFGGERNVEMLTCLIDRRQSQLREIARTLGLRLHSESSSAHCRRLERYWEAWREEHHS